MIEICKIINSISLPIMNSLFLLLENVHTIRNFQILSNSTKKTRYGLEAVPYRLPFLWANLLQDDKPKTLHAFKSKIRKCNGEICESFLCRHYKET